jgi:hypothetical protein
MHLPTGVPRDTRMDSPFSHHFLRFNFLEGHGAFACDQDLQVALTVRIRDLNRKFGGLQVSSGLTGRLACFRRYRGAPCVTSQLPRLRVMWMMQPLW